MQEQVNKLISQAKELQTGFDAQLREFDRLKRAMPKELQADLAQLLAEAKTGSISTATIQRIASRAGVEAAAEAEAAKVKTKIDKSLDSITNINNTLNVANRNK